MCLIAGPLDSSFEWEGPNVLIVDCRPFKDPKTMDLRDHLGLHPQIIDSAISHHALLRDVFLQVKSHIEYHDRPCVYFACSVGRHRSVAVLNIVKWCIMDKF